MRLIAARAGRVRKAAHDKIVISCINRAVHGSVAKSSSDRAASSQDPDR